MVAFPLDRKRLDGKSSAQRCRKERDSERAQALGCHGRGCHLQNSPRSLIGRTARATSMSASPSNAAPSRRARCNGSPRFSTHGLNGPQLRLAVQSEKRSEPTTEDTRVGIDQARRPGRCSTARRWTPTATSSSASDSACGVDSRTLRGCPHAASWRWMEACGGAHRLGVTGDTSWPRGAADECPACRRHRKAEAPVPAGSRGVLACGC